MEDRIKNAELAKWQEKYQTAFRVFSPQRDKLKVCQKQFDGDKELGTGTPASSIYNFTRELIESQIDTAIPMPSVQPRRASDRNRELADIIAVAVKNELDRMFSEEFNDLDERVTRIMGGDIYLTEWDNSQGTHFTVGEVSNRLVSPLEFIPQETVYDAARMDYFFLAFEETKERIKGKYKVDVEDETIDPTVSDRALSEANDLVTQIVCFYKNNGSVGCISWAGDTLLFNEKNYFARKDKICAQCGKTQAPGEKTCICGSDTWVRRDRDFESLLENVVKSDGTIIPVMSPVMENGAIKMEDYEEPVIEQATGGQMFNRIIQGGVVVGEEPMTQTKQRPMMEPTKIPYYVPKDFPIAVRRNMSIYMSFFGESDCAVIREQQIQANKAMTKIDAKIATTSEFFTKPRNLSFSVGNGQNGILNVDDPSQIAMIKSISLQFDMVSEYNVIEATYYQAKSLLGVTDSFQGKTDPTAQSGRAKELQIAQAAGIQRSKRVMKNAAYSTLFRNMFWFLLAFADEPRAYVSTDANGQQVEKVFNRYDFLERDEYGNWYYNDEFLFSVDEAGSMQNDKQFLLQDVRTDFSMGAFGDPAQPETMLQYWKEKEIIGYPNAKRMVKYWQEKIQAMQEAALAQQQAEEELIASGALIPGQEPMAPNQTPIQRGAPT